jgi:hypothetical protein
MRSAASTVDHQGALDAIDQDGARLTRSAAAASRARKDPRFVYRDESLDQHPAAAGNEIAVKMLRGIADRIRILQIYFTGEDRIGATITEHLKS